jgi:hypothetical protein
MKKTRHQNLRQSKIKIFKTDISEWATWFQTPKRMHRLPKEHPPQKKKTNTQLEQHILSKTLTKRDEPGIDSAETNRKVTDKKDSLTSQGVSPSVCVCDPCSSSCMSLSNFSLARSSVLLVEGPNPAAAAAPRQTRDLHCRNSKNAAQKRSCSTVPGITIPTCIRWNPGIIIPPRSCTLESRPVCGYENVTLHLFFALCNIGH